MVMAMMVMMDETAACMAQLAAAALTQCKSMKCCWLTLCRYLLAASLIFGIEGLNVVKWEFFVDQLNGEMLQCFESSFLEVFNSCGSDRIEGVQHALMMS